MNPSSKTVDNSSIPDSADDSAASRQGEWPESQSESGSDDAATQSTDSAGRGTRMDEPQVDQTRMNESQRDESPLKSSSTRHVRTAWAWNVPLLVASLSVLLLGSVAMAGLYVWQSGRIGSQLLELADRAAEENNPRDEAQWLQRYLGLRPDDADAEARLARIVNSNASAPNEIDQARRFLTRALATAEESGDVEAATKLRSQLVERMVQLGGGWYIEAERHILKLDPPAGDPVTLDQLARCLIGRSAHLVLLSPPSEPIDPKKQYWKWVLSQPVGSVLEMASEANPDSVELASVLIGAYLDSPELFAPRDGSAPDIASNQQQDRAVKAAALIRRLSTRADDGHAQWTSQFYAGRTGGLVDAPPLSDAAAAALARLRSRSETLAADTSESSDSEPVTEVATGDTAPSTENYKPVWDVQIVLTHANNLSQNGDFAEARSMFEALVALPDSMMSLGGYELASRGLGQTQWQLGDIEAAKATWRAANEKLGGFSLVLLEPLAAISANSAPIDEARADVKQLADAVEAASLRLASAGRAGMRDTQRDELQGQLNAANWRVDVLRGQVEYREGNLRGATQRLEQALASQIIVTPEARQEAAELLATIYGDQNLWDLAGRVLDEAAVAAPDNRDLQVRAADAWQRAASTTRAAEQLQRSDDGSFESALAYAAAVQSGLAAKAPAARDIRPLVAAINEAQKRLDQAIGRGELPPAAWRLALMRLSLPVDQRTAPAPGESVSTDQIVAGMTPDAQGLVDLSLRFPAAAELQGIVALAMLTAGSPVVAEEAAQRLEAVPGVDPMLVAEVRSRMAIVQGKPDEAATRMREAVAGATADRPRDVRQAAQFLESIGRRGDAIELLTAVPADAQDPEMLLQLGDLLLASRDPSANDAAANDPATAKIEVTTQLDQVQTRLRELEGDEGTRWRWLAAMRTLQGASSGKPAEIREAVTKASTLQTEITARRPRWSRGLTLGGRIAAAQGNARQAVDLLRRGIVEGDKEPTTVLLLASQLNRLGDAAGAEQELGRLAGMTDSVGRISALAVGLALGQGKFDSALERARAGVKTRPNDHEALLILAQTASSAARAGDPEQAETLRAEAGDALRRAIELTKGKDLGVWQTQFRIQLESGGSNAARQTLEAMGKSELPEKVRFLAVAGGFLALRDFDQASVWLDMAKAANPADENVALTRATLARTTNDNDAMLAAYQEAYRLAPQREDIRRTLALALAANNLSDVPWDQIDELVGPDSKSVSPADQLYHALILINRGDAGQIEKAREILRGLMAGGEPATVADAARLLITIERKRWDAAIKDGDVAGGNEALTELRRLYDLLVTKVDPVAGDLYGYGELLLAADLLTEAEAISDRLAAIAPASRAALDLPLQLAKKTGGETEVQSIVDAWLARFDNKNAAAAVTSAAQSLATVGMMDQAVQMLAKAYEKTPSLLAVYVAALAQSGKPDQAAKTSFDHFGKYRTAESVILLADSIVQGALLSMVDDEVNQVLSDAVKEFPANIKLIESVGTLRLTLQQYGEAVELYRQSEKLNPVSLITLNNLAVALAEISGRAEEGLVRIERAVELYGRNPELLDTLGVVQLRANRLAEAETNLREAYTKSTNDRHLFHLIQVLDAAMKIEELQSMWKQLDLTKINAEQLSPIDQKQLEQLKQRLGTPSQT